MTIPFVIVGFIAISVGLSGCFSAEPKEIPHQLRSLKEFVPENSSGRAPKGTREEPFIGEGVILELLPRASGELTRINLKHRPIPHFKRAMEMGIYLRPEIVEGLSEGDFIRLYYAALRPGSPEAALYATMLKMDRESARREKLPHVWFGYEIFKIERIPDAEVALSASADGSEK